MMTSGTDIPRLVALLAVLLARVAVRRRWGCRSGFVLGGGGAVFASRGGAAGDQLSEAVGQRAVGQAAVRHLAGREVAAGDSSLDAVVQDACDAAGRGLGVIFPVAAGDGLGEEGGYVAPFGCRGGDQLGDLAAFLVGGVLDPAVLTK